MEGEQTEYIWGVLDIIPLTDFPDIRARCAIHSAEHGAIMVMPREDRLVRIYCQLNTVRPGSDGRFDRSQITPNTILKAAQRIIRPYTIKYDYCDWWTVYQIDQRVGNHFSAYERIFLVGDAIHTHSPKAGQGMNASMQGTWRSYVGVDICRLFSDIDSHNLGWKLALVIKGIAEPAILKTYETERRTFAQGLISFDQKWSKLFSSRPTNSTADHNDILMSEFERAFVQQQLFSSGIGVCYSPSILIANTESATMDTKSDSGQENEEHTKGKTRVTGRQHLAANINLGKRFPSYRVINHCDANSWHFASMLKADAFLNILFFAGDVSEPSQIKRINTFANEIAARSQTVPLRHQCRIDGNASHAANLRNKKAVADILTIHSASRQQVEFHDFPTLLRPVDEKLGYDYNRIFVDEESYYEGHGQAYEGYGVDKTRGCLVVVRPDQYVAWIGELEDVEELEKYFAGFLVGAPALT